MDRTDLRTLAARWMHYWQGADLTGFNDVHDVAFVDRSAAGRASDRSAFRDGIADLYRAFPDFFAKIERIVIDETEQCVAIRWTATGTHRGDFMGETPRGAKVRFEGIEIIECRDGRVVARWGEWDGISIIRQIREASAQAS